MKGKNANQPLTEKRRATQNIVQHPLPLHPYRMSKNMKQLQIYIFNYIETEIFCIQTE